MTPAANPLHPWDMAPAEARALQERLAAAVLRSDALGRVRHVAGVDIGFEAAGSLTRAAIAVLAFPQLELVECSIATQPTCFPYIPGLLSFREAPAALAALGQLRQRPDLLMCDGQGIAHPRRFGLACHLGLLSGIPSIGVAKTRLVGEHGAAPPQRGDWAPVRDRGETIGAVLRSRAGVKPLYVSIGHRISLETASRMVMACVTRYRLPETTRWAHRLASSPATACAPRAPYPHPQRRDAR